MIITHRMSIEISQDGNTEGWSVDTGAEMAQIVDAAQDAAQALTEKIGSFSVMENQ